MDQEGAACAECWALRLRAWDDVLSDGRFAVLGGTDSNRQILPSCEALAVGDGEHREHHLPMHNARTHFVCAAVAGCIMAIVAGGHSVSSIKQKCSTR
jgi:hypothetical protein